MASLLAKNVELYYVGKQIGRGGSPRRDLFLSERHWPHGKHLTPLTTTVPEY